MTARTTVVGSGAELARTVSRLRHPTANVRSKARRPPAPIQFYAIFFIVILLTLFGLVMVLSASSVKAIHSGRSGWMYFTRQSLWAGLGVVALLAGFKVRVALIRRLVPLALGVSFALLFVVLVVGSKVNDARAWINFGSFSVQPAELTKLALVLYVADLLAQRADHMHDVRATVGPVLVVLGSASFLVLLQPDLGSVIVMVAIVLSMVFVAGAPLVPLAGALGVAGVGAALFALSSANRRARWLVFLDLAHNRSGTGYQVWQSLVGIASGGLTGVGLGASRAKWGYLPEAHTDFIFAIVAEELGLLGVVALVVLFVMLGLFGLQVARRAEDRFEMLLAGGVTAWLLLQAIVNIGGVTASLPLTGLTLPFVSFGGSSLLVSMAAAGLLLNVARRQSS